MAKRSAKEIATELLQKHKTPDAILDVASQYEHKAHDLISNESHVQACNVASVAGILYRHVGSIPGQHPHYKLAVETAAVKTRLSQGVAARRAGKPEHAIRVFETAEQEIEKVSSIVSALNEDDYHLGFDWLKTKAAVLMNRGVAKSGNE